VFVPRKPFQPRIIFASKASASQVKHLSCAPLLVVFPTNIILGRKALPRINSSLLWKLANYSRKKVSQQGMKGHLEILLNNLAIIFKVGMH
jgi:hypothetical protein